MGARSSSTVDEQSNDFPYRSAQLAHVDSHVTAMNYSLGGFTAKLTEMEQNMGPLAARMWRTGNQNVVCLGRRDPQQHLDPCLDKLVVSQLLGPVTRALQMKNKNFRRKLETSPDEEILRRAVLLRLPCDLCRAGFSAWLAKQIQGSEKDCEVHYKSGSKPARLVFATKARCPQFVELYEASIQSTVSFATVQPQSLSAQIGRIPSYWVALCAALRGS